MSRLLPRIGLAALACAVTVVLAEGALRIAGPDAYHPWPPSTEFVFHPAPDPHEAPAT